MVSRFAAAVLIGVLTVLSSACSNPDREAEKAIAGIWKDQPPQPTLVRFTPDHKFLIAADFNGAVILNGTWSVKDSTILCATDDGKAKFVEQILSVDSTTLVTRGNGTINVRSRATATELEALLSKEPKSFAEIRRSRQASSSPPGPAEAPEAQSKADTQFLDDSYYVPENRVLRVPLSVRRRAKIQIVIDTQGPIDVVVLPANVTPADYVRISAYITSGGTSESLLQILSGEPPSAMKVDPTPEAVLANPLSKQGVFGQRNITAELDPGEYAIFLDNLGTFTPSRGDVPVKLQLFSN